MFDARELKEAEDTAAWAGAKNPSDLLHNSLPKQLRNRVITNSTSGGGKRPGLLRRRSMGTELLSLGNTGAMKERQLVQKYLNPPF